ncbi:hypothetical protein [Herbidospora mongoliensis]|uniref:hypothetical protein n=1 Tax=Herbidospora mongoliensis TaxID=688067 RepID=UPI0012F92A70|nr:hypothetical protein [Herbidospora mongoliensis]
MPWSGASGSCSISTWFALSTGVREAIVVIPLNTWTGATGTFFDSTTVPAVR